MATAAGDNSFKYNDNVDAWSFEIKFTWISAVNCRKNCLQKCLCITAQRYKVIAQDLQEGGTGC